MEGFITSVPQTPIGWITILLIVIGSLSVFFSKKRQEDMLTLRNFNADLLSKIEYMQKDLDTLKGQVDTLEKQNKTLEDLVIISLKQYFFENPMVAKDLKEKILK